VGNRRAGEKQEQMIPGLIKLQANSSKSLIKFKAGYRNHEDLHLVKLEGDDLNPKDGTKRLELLYRND
jgi:hypothetical protein